MMIERIRKKGLYVIAEIGVNHNGSLSLAKEMLLQAAKCGADAVKFQTFKTEDLVDDRASLAAYQKSNLKHVEQTQFEMLKKLELSLEAHHELKKMSDLLGVDFLSTPHSGISSAKMLLEVGVPCFKIGSGDLSHLPFLEELSLMNKPILLSTGMATMEEISEAVSLLKEKNTEIILFQCTSEYPCPPEHVNLRVLQTYKSVFNIPVGFSDHTSLIESGAAAIRHGAIVLEKHFTLSQELPGPDHRASLPPNQFKTYIELARQEQQRPYSVSIHPELEKTLMGSGVKSPTEEEIKTSKLVRKSIHLNVDNQAGDAIQADHLSIKRPETGIKPKHIKQVIGKKLKHAIEKGKALLWEDLE